MSAAGFGGVRDDNVTLQDALSAYLAQQGLTPVTTLGQVAGCWVDVVGNDVAEHVVPWRLDDGELVVAVDDPAWATEIGFLSGGILAALTERLGNPVAERVKAHVKLRFGLD